MSGRAGNDWKWIEKAGKSWKMLEIAGNGLKQLEMAGHGQREKWLEMFENGQNGWKLLMQLEAFNNNLLLELWH